MALFSIALIHFKEGIQTLFATNFAKDSEIVNDTIEFKPDSSEVFSFKKQ